MAATPSPTPSPSPSSSSSPQQPQSQQPESESKSLLATTEAAPKLILLAIPVQAQKKPQPVQWTPEETANLIEAYQEKWYSLKKGQLKAHQWEEVTVTAAARCGYDEPNKTSTQCRHKMEKLRKRYRAEKRKSSSSAWPFFDLMDRMECGPEPISARPVNMVRFPNSVTKPQGDEEDDEDEDNDDDNNRKRPNNRSRSINNLLRKPTTVNRFPGSSRFPLSSIRKREELTTDTDDEDEDEDEEFEVEVNKEKSVGGDKRLLLGLAAEMRSFAQRIAGVEKKKMEMMRETEKIRMEMESKRVKMILDSQSKMMETIDNWSSDGRGPRKKMKVTTTATQI